MNAGKKIGCFLLSATYHIIMHWRNMQAEFFRVEKHLLAKAALSLLDTENAKKTTLFMIFKVFSDNSEHWIIQSYF